MIENFKEFEGVNCTLITTEQCNLRCKYCYENHKNPSKLKLQDALDFVHYMIFDADLEKLASLDEFMKRHTRAIIFDFIGGDALVDPEFLDQVCKYIASNMPRAQAIGRYPFGWRLSLSSNGTLFERKDVRDFCEKWKDNLSLGVSLDGCPELHDLNRVFVDGTGSMDTIRKWWPWYQKNFPLMARTTKATFSRNSIPYLYDSVKFLHEELGIKYIECNFIMENTYATDKDFEELERQLSRIVDYELDHCDELFVRFFENKPGKYEDERKDKNRSWCGSGCMPCLSTNGKIYPCFRWAPLSQNGEDVMCIGDAKRGITDEGYEIMKSIVDRSRRNKISTKECLECPYEFACSYCIAGCYNEFHEFKRTTYICNYTKIIAKYSEIYWNKYYQLKGKKD